MTSRHESTNATQRANSPRLSPFQQTVSKTERLIAELRRRHVFQIAVGWAAAAFALIQFAELTYPVFNFPAWAYPVTVYAILGGTPLVLALAWIYDITREGIRRTEPIEPALAAPVAHHRTRQSHQESEGHLAHLKIMSCPSAASVLAYRINPPSADVGKRP